MPENTKFTQPFHIDFTENNYPVLIEPCIFVPTEEAYEVPIPQLIQEMRVTEPDLALKWDLQIRKIIQTLFIENYSIIAVRKTNEPVNYYQFIKKMK